MAPTHAGHGARFGGNRQKTRPILASAAPAGAGAPVVFLPTRRTGGVVAPTPMPPRRTVTVVRPAPADEVVPVALELIASLQIQARGVADGYRRKRLAEANRGLAELVQSAQKLLRLALAAAQASGVDLGDVCEVDGVRVDVETRTAVERLIAHQFSCDWAGVADTLDRELAPALAQWQYVFEALSGSPDDHGGRAA